MDDPSESEVIQAHLGTHWTGAVRTPNRVSVTNSLVCFRYLQTKATCDLDTDHLRSRNSLPPIEKQATCDLETECDLDTRGIHLQNYTFAVKNSKTNKYSHTRHFSIASRALQDSLQSTAAESFMALNTVR